MNIFMDPVECGAKLEETTQSGAMVKIICDGVMLPIESKIYPESDDLLIKTYGDVPVKKYWKCHKCGREVK